jgi:outer membrane protein assembly factor BamB
MVMRRRWAPVCGALAVTGGIAACDAILGDLHDRDANVPEDGHVVGPRDSGVDGTLADADHSDAERPDVHGDVSSPEIGPPEEAGDAGDPGNLKGLQDGAPWPMQDRDPNHTCQSPYIGPASVHVAWTLELHGTVTNPPAIAADGTLYTVSEGTQSFFAISPSGERLWTVTLPDQPNNDGHRTPAIAADGTLYVGTENALVALYSDGGTTRWTYNTSESFYGGPSVAPNGTIYASTVAGSVFAIHPAGTAIWSYNAGSPIYPSTTFGQNGSIYSGSAKNVFALQSDGGLEWQVSVPDGGLFASPSIAPAGTIYAASNDHAVYAFDTSGAPSWSLTTGGKVVTDIAVATDGTVYFGSFDQKFYAVSPDGGVKWTYATGADIEATPVVGSDGTVYSASDNGVVFALSPDGGVVWSHTVAPLSADAGPLRMFGGSIDAYGTLYIGTGDGRLIAFSR